MRTKLSPLQIDEVGIRYQAGESSVVLAKKYKVTHATISNMLKRQGIACRTHSVRLRKYSCNHAFFADIASEEQAYWLGFLLADGAIIDDSRIVVGLAVEDRGHLEKMARALNSSHPILTYKYPTQHSSRFSLRSPQMTEDLRILGVVARKSFIAIPPPIVPALKRHFWRGVIDGDGSLSLPSPPSLDTPGVSLVGSKDTCEQFATYINDAIGSKVHACRHGSIWRVSLHGWRSAYPTMNLLYGQATVFLDRKMSIVKDTENAFHLLASRNIRRKATGAFPFGEGDKAGIKYDSSHCSTSLPSGGVEKS